MKEYEGIVELQAKNDHFKVRKKVKEITGTQKYNRPNLLKNKDGKIITEIEEKIKTWKTYIVELFEDERYQRTIEPQQDNSGSKPTKEEVNFAIRELKCGKASVQRRNSC